MKIPIIQLGLCLALAMQVGIYKANMTGAGGPYSSVQDTGPGPIPTCGPQGCLRDTVPGPASPNSGPGPVPTCGPNPC